MQSDSQTATAQWAGKSALIVDDYPSIRKTMRELVQSLGLQVREAENGVAALERLKEQTPDLIVTDLVMPEMDGFELTEAVKTAPQWRLVPVIVISTHADSRYIFRALKLGADDYLTKPATREMMQKVLARMFDYEW